MYLLDGTRQTLGQSLYSSWRDTCLIVGTPVPLNPIRTVYVHICSGMQDAEMTYLCGVQRSEVIVAIAPEWLHTVPAELICPECFRVNGG
jgi:hypothetical protein